MNHSESLSTQVGGDFLMPNKKYFFIGDRTIPGGNDYPLAKLMEETDDCSSFQTGDPADNGKFKSPSIRNLTFTAPYMHDGRFATLKEVVEHYNSGVLAESPNLDSEMEHFKGGLDLTLEQKNDLVSFLHTMSDNTFLENPDFSDPN